MNRYVTQALLLGLLLVGISACEDNQPEEAVKEEILTEVNVSLQDSIARKIFDAQDHQQSDSLTQYFNHRDPTYRYLAAKAFGSIQDSAYIGRLASLLEDPIIKVRQAAAFAMGQTGLGSAENALIQAFQNQDSIDPNNSLNTTILEAIGKCGSQANLPLLSQVTTYENTDRHLLLGQTRAIFQYMLRGLVDESGTDRMVNLLANEDVDPDVRMVASHYLARADIPLRGHADLLNLTAENLDSSDLAIQMPMILGKIGDRRSEQLLKSYLQKSDYRIQCNVLRVMASQNFGRFRSDIQKFLYSKNILVASTAAEMIKEHGTSSHWRTYMNLSLGNFPWQVKISLLHALEKLIPRGNAMFSNMNTEYLLQPIRSSKNVYEKAAAIKALGENARSSSRIIRLLDNAKHQVVETACIDALAHIATSPGFGRLNQNSRKEVIDILVAALQSGDAAKVEISTAIFDIDLANYEVNVDETIQNALSNLEVPKDMEAIIALRTSQAKISGGVYDPTQDFQYTHSIDWSTLDGLAPNPTASITTNRGTITVQLDPLLAPGTVANFIDLASMNYYKDQTIHRVVPGFVMQGGCNRGDGYGSMDYAIRSELSQKHYDTEGYLGMASAGRHTESTQWFITQNATPHLDGRYTIFGKVLEGMDVVHATQVGDIIQDIQIH